MQRHAMIANRDEHGVRGAWRFRWRRIPDDHLRTAGRTIDLHAIALRMPEDAELPPITGSLNHPRETQPWGSGLKVWLVSYVIVSMACCGHPALIAHRCRHCTARMQASLIARSGYVTASVGIGRSDSSA